MYQVASGALYPGVDRMGAVTDSDSVSPQTLENSSTNGLPRPDGSRLQMHSSDGVGAIVAPWTNWCAS